MQSTAMPARETLENFGRTGATLAIHLSIRNIKKIQNDLEPYYGANCPTAIVYRATWSDQKILRANSLHLRNKLEQQRLPAQH